MELKELIQTTWNSFYVSGKAWNIARKLKSVCTNATERASIREIHLNSIDSSAVDDAEHMNFRKTEIQSLYAIQIEPMRKEERDFRRMLEYGFTLRALVVGYKKTPDVSEIIPCDYELNQSIEKGNAALGLEVLK